MPRSAQLGLFICLFLLIPLIAAAGQQVPAHPETLVDESLSSNPAWR